MGKTNKYKYPHSVGNLQASQVNTALIIMCVCVCVCVCLQVYTKSLFNSANEEVHLRVTHHGSEKQLYSSQNDFFVVMFECHCIWYSGTRS